MIRIRLSRELLGWAAVFVRELAAGQYGFVPKSDRTRLETLSAVLDHADPDDEIAILNTEWVYIRRGLDKVAADAPQVFAKVRELRARYENALVS